MKISIGSAVIEGNVEEFQSPQFENVIRAIINAVDNNEKKSLKISDFYIDRTKELPEKLSGDEPFLSEEG